MKGRCPLVIQSNMTPKAIADIWENTRFVFNKFNIPLSDSPLELLVETNILNSLLKELNDKVGSSAVTCIEGG